MPTEQHEHRATEQALRTMSATAGRGPVQLLQREPELTAADRGLDQGVRQPR
jgi:hypothetical protein